MAEADVARARRNAWIALIAGITVAYGLGYGAGRALPEGLGRVLANFIVYAGGVALACRAFWTLSRPLAGRGQRAHPIAVMAVMVAVSGDRMTELGYAAPASTIGSMLMTATGIFAAMALYWMLNPLDVVEGHGSNVRDMEARR
jgi:hypothetical protein